MDLFSDDLRRDPYPAYDLLRRNSPVFFFAPFDVWMVFDYGGVWGRLEGRIGLADLLRHAPPFERAGTGPWEPRQAFGVLGPSRLPVRFRAD